MENNGIFIVSRFYFNDCIQVFVLNVCTYFLTFQLNTTRDLPRIKIVVNFAMLEHKEYENRTLSYLGRQHRIAPQLLYEVFRYAIKLRCTPMRKKDFILISFHGKVRIVV